MYKKSWLCWQGRRIYRLKRSVKDRFKRKNSITSKNIKYFISKYQTKPEYQSINCQFVLLITKMKQFIRKTSEIITIFNLRIRWKRNLRNTETEIMWYKLERILSQKINRLKKIVHLNASYNAKGPKIM